jgi:hypothetical protein
VFAFKNIKTGATTTNLMMVSRHPVHTFDVGDPVVIFDGRWVGESGEVHRVTRCYIWVTLTSGFRALVRKDHLMLIADAASEDESDGISARIISDDEADTTDTE